MFELGAIVIILENFDIPYYILETKEVQTHIIVKLNI